MSKLFMGNPSETEWDVQVKAQLEKFQTAGQDLRKVWKQHAAKVLRRRELLFPYQLKLLLDPSKNKGTIATRRAGKTKYLLQEASEALCNYWWEDVMQAQPVIQYIGPTQKRAMDLFWRPFHRLCDELGFEAVWDDHNLRALFSNGVLVRASGVATNFDIENYRGDAYVLAMIDEAASYGAKLESLIVEGLGMAMLDYNGTRVVVGTPGATKSGFLYDAVHGNVDGWSFHPKWDFRNNPVLMGNIQKLGISVDEWISKNIGPLHSAKVRREAYGEWVTDANELVYQFDRAKNLCDALPPVDGEWSYGLGLDVGYRDPTAWTVVAWHEQRSELFVVLSECKSDMPSTEIAEKVLQLNNQYHFRRIVMDTSGSMARNSMDDWNIRYDLGIIPAKKAPGYKHPAIMQLNGDFYSGDVKLLKATTEVLQKELLELPWAELKGDAKRHDRSVEHPGYANHCADSLLYISRESQHWRLKKNAAAVTPRIDNHDYWRAMLANDRKMRLEQLNKAASMTVEDALIEDTWSIDDSTGIASWIER